MVTSRSELSLFVSLLAAGLLLALAAGCGGGGNSGQQPNPQLDPSPQVDAGQITANWGAQSGFQVLGGPGAAEPGALLILRDAASNTTSAVANPDGSFELLPDPQTFNAVEGSTLTLTQTAPNKAESEAIDILVPPM
jgi:hypothetical protein